MLWLFCIFVHILNLCYTTVGGDFMGGKTSAASINKYIAKAYDRINLTVPKGRKEIIQAHAEALGTSVNGFINRAIDEAMDRDKRAQEGSGGPPEDTGE